MRLVLRRATVLSSEDCVEGAEQRLVAEVEGLGEREAISDSSLYGLSQAGDEVIVNVQAGELGLGSGGFDIVHANLTRGLTGEGLDGAHVMKLNYSSLQHAVVPVEDEEPPAVGGRPVAACLLHGQLAPLAWAFSQAAPQATLGLVQGAGGALPGNHSRTVVELRRRGLLGGFITAGPAYGGELEAITGAGAIAHGLGVLGWDAVVCAPGPGIIGSGSRLGNGALAAAEALHAAIGLEALAILVPRLSDSDPRERHRGVSHHTRTVASLVLGPGLVAWPQGSEAGQLGELAAREGQADLAGYAASGLPTSTMGRSIEEDPAFFAAGLAGGSVLAGLVAG
ncbi:MAG: DUF3866 family protein [Solirubrobacterales bacterium]